MAAVGKKQRSQGRSLQIRTHKSRFFGQTLHIYDGRAVKDVNGWRKKVRMSVLILLAALLLAESLAWRDVTRQAQAAMANALLPEGPFVALTFDDGPKAVTTSRLLDGLEQRGVRATFFVLGDSVAGNEELLRRMAAEGHQIGMHTAHHKMLAGLNAADFSAEVDGLRVTLTELLGAENFMLRPPYGAVTAAVQNWAAAPIILWSVDPEDWSDYDVQRITNHIVENAKDGDIILLHDIHDTSVDAALQVVDKLMAKGYTFVTVEELFALRGIEPENGKVYRKLPPQTDS